MFSTQRSLAPLSKIKLNTPTPTPKLRQLPTLSKIDLAYDLYLPSKSTLTSFHSNKGRYQSPIVFLPGFYGYKSSYKSILKTLSNSTYSPVYALDLRNHGDSPHALPVDNNTLTNDVLHFIDQHQLTNVNIIGFSLGAKLALLALLRQPDLFKSGIIIDNSPIGTPQSNFWLQAVHDAMMELMTVTKIPSHDKDWMDKASRVICRHFPLKPLAQYALHGYSNTTPKPHISDYDPGFCHFELPVRLLDQDIVEQVNHWPTETVEGLKYEGPVKVIRALASDFINNDGVKAFKEYFPNHEITDLKTGHHVFEERESDSLQIMEKFLTGLQYQDLSLLANQQKQQQLAEAAEAATSSN